MNFLVKSAALLAFGTMACAAQAEAILAVGYLKQAVVAPAVLSNLDPVPETLGVDGARLGQADNQSSGRFLGHSYVLDVSEVDPGGDLLAAARTLLATSPYLILDASADDILRVADLPEAQDALIFNASAQETRLRDAECRRNLFHTLPSAAMRADALMQVLMAKRFSRLALVAGEHPADRAFADALRRSAAKFGLKITGEREWRFDADMRRNASQEVPLFTQDLPEHDVLLIADETNDFGRYIAYNTWLPRPVAGSEGMVPVAWSRVVEQWGAAQLQSRFVKLAGRDMKNRDYAAWAAMRVLGEALTRTGSTDPAQLRAYILSPEFELAGFKGRPMSFRHWNGQLRQPIPLVTDRAVVMQAPVEGFLHQRSELDTLGIDLPESRCTAFKE
ncbi:amino acid/amide ABC transporter substrate-binding protein, HAAT family [Ruegeria marina]|uniref:Amino acid/amide ABC transporter substrate-binding protein, HAAT family n=2 Tax=Ruegeria marina TaxID=639004 RepID=A0A1G6SQW1_9RHOB|nr:ABC transporter substrate-binding protein [Ruegeria marina]SDD19262.1 amino acid/amide ABC transporter substrate-binding protein, HAAT family [Ruegeria marina]